MTHAALLMAYGVGMGWFGDQLLARLSVQNVIPPRVALWWCHALVLSVLTALALGLALAAHDVWEHSVSWLLHADKSRVHAAYAGPREVAPAWNFALVVLAALGAAGAVAGVRDLRVLQRSRAAHRLLHQSILDSDREVLPDVVHANAEIVLVRDAAPLIYCVPGGRASGSIVVTTAVSEVLSRSQLAAALEHEEVHLARHHHRQVLAAEVVAAALRLPRLLQNYPRCIRLLVELEADSRAAGVHGRHVVASALLDLSCVADSEPPTALAMATTGMSLRVHRLMGPPRGTRRAVVTATATAAGLLAAAPSIAAATPLVSLAGSVHAPDSRPDGADEGFVHHP